MLGIFLDQETTGLDPRKHQVIEIALKVVNLGTGKELFSYESVVKLPHEAWLNRDPSSILVNGFEEALIQKGKSLNEISHEIVESLQKIGIVRGKAVFVCQNPSFDRPFFALFVDPYVQEKLSWPYHWLDLASMYWAQEVEKSKKLGVAIPEEMRLSKDAIAASYRLPPEQKPHRAMNGVNHLIQCYEAVVGFPDRA